MGDWFSDLVCASFCFGCLLVVAAVLVDLVGSCVGCGLMFVMMLVCGFCGFVRGLIGWWVFVCWFGF